MTHSNTRRASDLPGIWNYHGPRLHGKDLHYQMTIKPEAHLFRVLIFFFALVDQLRTGFKEATQVSTPTAIVMDFFS